MNRRPCERHREALAELAERPEPSPAGAAAIAHVGRCRDCADLLGDLMLTVVALRRMAADPAPVVAAAMGLGDATLPPAPAESDSAWTRLRARIERSRQAAREQAWRWRASLGGMLASALVVATLVGPATLRFGAGGAVGSDLVGGSPADFEAASWQIEADYVSGAHSAPSADAATGAGSDLVAFRRYPDDLRPGRKEVASARSTGPSPDAR